MSNGIAEGDLIVDYSKAEGDTVDLAAGAASVLTSFLLDGNLVVVLAGTDGDVLEFANVTSLADIAFV
ncbi:MAG: hypothetical protein IPK78_19235 [Rhodospirillales bacterium]|nr:hypothetical protein [Rhodospirillales bacterium]